MAKPETTHTKILVGVKTILPIIGTIWVSEVTKCRISEVLLPLIKITLMAIQGTTLLTMKLIFQTPCKMDSKVYLSHLPLIKDYGTAEILPLNKIL